MMSKSERGPTFLGLNAYTYLPWRVRVPAARTPTKPVATIATNISSSNAVKPTVLRVLSGSRVQGKCGAIFVYFEFSFVFIRQNLFLFAFPPQTHRRCGVYAALHDRTMKLQQLQ